MATIMDETLEAEVSKQATKALKCVAYTSKQVGDILRRKHERVLQRIGAVSQEIESLKHDIADNVAHQRERRQQLNEAEEDLERAQLLGNNAIINELLEEIQVLQEENKREEALHRALSRTVRMRIEAKRLFQRERLAVEDEMRSFEAKQKLIQTLLSECAKNSSSQGSSASQSDCGASDLEDEEPEQSGEGRGSLSSSSGSSVSSGSSRDKVHAADRPKSIMKASSSLDSPTKRPTLRVRSWSSDCVPADVPIEQQQTRTRHSLSVHFASPVLTAVAPTRDELMRDVAALDLSGCMESIAETTDATGASAAAPVKPSPSPSPSTEPQRPLASGNEGETQSAVVAAA
ncbi:hypothetical protein P43SY_004031 [Pythium insidiosum]|uniref:Uncharacterized protein n=1 Tax=Pythium insidiosum TaxID=114742 RepID=A0AAD5Q8V1_PYTIN|nr:hypothetical protein P43SY_004031 [Pythium insidiosum]